jgi:hypothetical protein
LNIKKDMGRILTQGTPMQRLNLLWNHRAETEFEEGKGFLSETEEEMLSRSFKTPEEIRLYNRHLHLYRGLVNGFSILTQLSFKYMETMAQLRGYALYDLTRSKITDLVNDLYFGSGSEKEKARLLKTLEAHGGFFFFDLKPGLNPEEDGIAAVDQKHSLRELPQILLERGIKELAEAKAAIAAIEETLQGSGFQIKFFQDHLVVIIEGLKKEQAFVPKYSQRQTEAAFGKGVAPVYQDSWMFPDYEDVATDEALKVKLKVEAIGG